MTEPKIIVAIDSSNPEQALNIIDQLDSELCMIKIGSVNFNSLGNLCINQAFEKGFKIFLDLKLHDIPNTVKESILGLRHLPISMLTIHTSGGLNMMRAAVEGVEGTNIKIFGVTALTSLSDSDSERIFRRNIRSQVSSLLDLAEEGGIVGVVCSPQELELLSQRKSLLSVSPGIRLKNLNEDQKRVMTPIEAIGLGADYIVIGRPLLNANNPNIFIKKILNSF